MAHCEHCDKEHDDKLKICPASGNLFALDRFFTKAKVLDGKYRLDDLVAASETAVFTATHALLNKKVAVKILFPEADLQQTTRQMIKEARAVSATGHPNIVAITDLGLSPEGALFIVMEYIQGPTLAEVIEKDAPLPVSRATWIVSEILAGLSAVAKKGITHQDLTASNVMLIKDDLGQPAIKIMDFCVGRVTQADLAPGKKRPPRQDKTLIYLSPEQIRSRDDVDQRTDIYACGVLLYHMLTGHPPFSGGDQLSLIASILEGEASAPSSKVPSIPAEMDSIVMKAMHGHRARRFASAAELRSQLASFLSRDQDEELEWSPPSAKTAGESAPPRQVTLDLTSPDPGPAKKRKPKPTPPADMPELQATQDVDMLLATGKTGKVPRKKTPRPDQTGKLGITAPPKRAREPLASQEIFQDLDTPEPETKQPREPPPSEEISLDLDAMEANVVPLDGLGGPPETEDDMELDLDQDRLGDEAFLPGPEQDDSNQDDLFSPGPDDGVQSLAMLQVADDPYTSGMIASRDTGRQQRITGPNESARRPRATGSAAFDGEQEDDFHRSAIWVLVVILLVGAGWAIWPNRHTLLPMVTGDYSGLKMLQLKTTPADATIYVNGKLQQARPIRFSGDQEKLEVRVQAEGYASKVVTFQTDQKAPLEIVLKRR